MDFLSESYDVFNHFLYEEVEVSIAKFSAYTQPITESSCTYNTNVPYKNTKTPKRSFWHTFKSIFVKKFTDQTPCTLQKASIDTIDTTGTLHTPAKNPVCPKLQIIPKMTPVQSEKCGIHAFFTLCTDVDLEFPIHILSEVKVQLKLSIFNILDNPKITKFITLLEAVRASGVTFEGVLKTDGNAATYMEIVQHLKNEEHICLKSYSTPNLTSALKYFIREKLKGIFPAYIVDILSIMGKDLTNSRKRLLQNYLPFILTASQKFLLQQLFSLFSTLSAYFSVTKMSVRNCILSMLPSLFPHEPLTDNTDLTNVLDILEFVSEMDLNQGSKTVIETYITDDIY